MKRKNGVTALQYNNITVLKNQNQNFEPKFYIYNIYIYIYIYIFIYKLYMLYFENWLLLSLRCYLFALRKLLSVICYLLLPFFAFHWKIPFSALFFTAPNIAPMILPQFQVNKSIVLHLSALYSAIYDNHQDLYFKIWLFNQLIHREM